MEKNSAIQTTRAALALEPINDIDPMEFIYRNAAACEVSTNTDSPLHKKRNQYFKRSFDLLLSSIFIWPFLCILPFVALLIKLGSKGPVFFLQKRAKKNGEMFTCIKFRTMEACSDTRPEPVLEDDRITRAGTFLRKYHLDELPQLLNVLWGDMSLVGPRPHMTSDNEKFKTMVDDYAARHTVKPGITGLAQILGHIGPVITPTEIQDRVKSDIFYIKNWSVVLDAKIICRSFLRMPGNRGKTLHTKTLVPDPVEA